MFSHGEPKWKLIIPELFSAVETEEATQLRRQGKSLLKLTASEILIRRKYASPRKFILNSLLNGIH